MATAQFFYSPATNTVSRIVNDTFKQHRRYRYRYFLSEVSTIPIRLQIVTAILLPIVLSILFPNVSAILYRY